MSSATFEIFVYVHTCIYTYQLGLEGGSHLAQWGVCYGRFAFFKTLIFLRCGLGISTVLLLGL